MGRMEGSLPSDCEWTIVRELPRRKLLARCSCGAEHVVNAGNVYTGKSKRCQKCRYLLFKLPRNVAAHEHARQLGLLWNEYRRLKDKCYLAQQRCADTTKACYGGRGIEFRFESTEAMLEHLLTLPGCRSTSLVLDRKDNDGHYEAGNLRFVTRSESQANTRRAAKYIGRSTSLKGVRYR